MLPSPKAAALALRARLWRIAFAAGTGVLATDVVHQFAARARLAVWQEAVLLFVTGVTLGASWRALANSIQRWRATPRVKLYAAPGSTIARVLLMFVSQRTYDEVLSQPIADLQFEYARALAERGPREAFRVRLGGYRAIVAAVAERSLPWLFALGNLVMKVWKLFASLD